MIYIGICDDETIHQIKNRDCCEQFFSGKNIDHSYIFFHSIFDVLSYSSHHISVLLLDIEMNDSINGVQLMHRLQHSRFVESIIFISSHTNYVYDSFSPKTIGFCPKPVKIERLFPLLESSLRSHCSNHPVSFNSAPEGKSILVTSYTYIQPDTISMLLHTHPAITYSLWISKVQKMYCRTPT